MIAARPGEDALAEGVDGVVDDGAEAAGVELGDIQTISEYTNNGPVPMFDRAAAPMAQGASVPIQPGQMLVTLDVSVAFGIR